MMLLADDGHGEKRFMGVAIRDGCPDLTDCCTIRVSNS